MATINLDDKDEGLVDFQLPNGQTVSVDLLEIRMEMQEIEQRHGGGQTLPRECLVEFKGLLESKGITVTTLRQAYRAYLEVDRLVAEQKKSIEPTPS